MCIINNYNNFYILTASKPAIFMVLHHTFDPEKVVPDSSRCINRTNTRTVDFLFHEDEGLLKCMKNEEALARIKQWLLTSTQVWHVVLIKDY